MNQDFRRIYRLSNYEPHVMQKEFCSIAMDEKYKYISLKAPTGSGKTEATTFPFLTMEYKVIYVSPTCSLVDDHERRFERIFLKLSAQRDVPLTLAIDRGNDVKWTIFWKGKHKSRTQHYYNANIILTTFDKFIYRLCGYGTGKSFLYPYRLFHKGERIAVIFDETHLYIPLKVALTNLSVMTERLVNLDNAKVILSSATLPDWAINELSKLARIKDTKMKHCNFLSDEGNVENLLHDLREKGIFGYNEEIELHFNEISLKDKDELVKLILKHYDPEKKFIVKIHTYKGANEIFGKLKGKVINLYLYHGHMPSASRELVYRELKKLEKESSPYLLITTHAIEVGCDLDADIMALELCPPESFIQSLGRLNRRLKRKGCKLIVVGSNFSNIHKKLYEEAGRYHQIRNHMIDTLEKFNGRTVSLVELTREISEITEGSDYKSAILAGIDEEVKKMLRRYLNLVHLLPSSRDLRDAFEQWEKPKIVTRAYEPSALLAIKGREKETELTVEISSLLAKKGAPREANVSIKRFDHEEERYVPVNVKSIPKNTVYGYLIEVLIPDEHRSEYLKEEKLPDGKIFCYYIQVPAVLRFIRRGDEICLFGKLAYHVK